MLAVSADENVNFLGGGGCAGFASITLRYVCESALNCRCGFWGEISRVSRDLLEERARLSPNATRSDHRHCNAAERQSRGKQSKHKYMMIGSINARMR